MTIRTRFAPSPTGFLHIGGARTALYNWLLAKQRGGAFVLRVEDTDTERSTRDSIAQILEGLEWLGLAPDEGPTFQMDRLDRYREISEQLISADKAYRCYCSREELASMREALKSRGLKPRYDGRCRHRAEPVPGVDPVVRFSNPASGRVTVHDQIHGDVVFDNAELDDVVILRSDGVPTYNFAVVVDDSDMGITHVVRGDDHLNNTPRQLNIIEALGLKPPQYAHLPMILSSDGSRLSKRHGALSVLEYRDAGFLPEAVLNYIARLGWSHGDQEIFTIEELIESFDFADVNHAPAGFDPDKALWVNQQWLASVSTERLMEALKPYLADLGYETRLGPELAHVAEIQRHRAESLVEMAQKSGFVYEEPSDYAPKAAKQHLRPVSMPVLDELSTRLDSLTVWTVESTQEAVSDVAAKLGLKLGKVAQPLRVAVTGDSASPGIGETLFLIGKDRTLARLSRARDYVRARAESQG